MKSEVVKGWKDSDMKITILSLLPTNILQYKLNKYWFENSLSLSHSVDHIFLHGLQMINFDGERQNENNKTNINRFRCILVLVHMSHAISALQSDILLTTHQSTLTI